MNKIKAIQTIEKYKGVGRLLGVQEDEKILDEIIDIISNYNDDIPEKKNSNAPKQNKYGEGDFQQIISSNEMDLSLLEINSQIPLNKAKMLNYWYSINDEDKNNFTIFELNIILFLISNQYNKYQKKDKRKIISLINNVVKDKRMSIAYDNIVV